MKKFSFTDDDLRKAIARVAEIRLKQLDELEDYTYTFSDAFNEKMARLIRRVMRRMYAVTFAKRVAAVFAAMLVGITAWLTFDVEARAAVFEWVKEVYENSIVYRYWGEPITHTLPQYDLTYLPDGFEKVDGWDDETRSSSFYINKETGDAIIYEYRFINNYSHIQIFEPTFDSYETVYIQENEKIYLPKNNTSNSNTILWINQTQDIFFKIDSTLEQNQILDIIEKNSLTNK